KRDKLEKVLGREPTVAELSEAMGVPPEELTVIMEAGAEVESLYRPVYQGEGTEISLIDKLPEKEDRQEHLLNKIFLEEILRKLEPRERQLIYMRYFQDMTQTEIAGRLGISQVQVSRMEKRILKRLKAFQDGR
ncbi:MAG TPA: sigma-70 family RNA polymerase sigma factor, partial [Candidatus Blautia excrementipullorum]|nr:sigma-70 family RNA polymerase sigma factor [Candidatus Blautia excrementipullorum]